MSMSKKSSKIVEPSLDVLRFSSSAFTLTFVIEVVGIDVWHDCNEGWLDLGPVAQGVKISYGLYPGQTFDVDVVIWPHVAKVYCKNNYGWVRTWQFLQRRWLTFSIRHAFPVRVKDLRNFVATVTPNFGIGALSANSKIGNAAEVYLPPLRFGDRRQFAEVVEANCPIYKYFADMIWFLVVNYIPTSNMDGLFDTPYSVKDVRHQDAALYQVQDVILNRRVEEEEEVKENENVEQVRSKLLKREQSVKEMKQKPGKEKDQYEIKLSGDWITAGIGRVTPFVTSAEDCPTARVEVMALISSINLPAQDDFPVFFVNVCNLTDVPIEHLKQNRFTHIYTRWTISEEERNSEQQPLQTKEPRTDINFNDHHSVPLPSAVASDVMATFLDEPFRVELRGIRTPENKLSFFGCDKADRDYGIRVPPPIPYQDVDILIAQTRIDAKALTKINGSVKGEFPLYPPEVSVVSLEREGVCTNDINAVRAKVNPDLIIQPGVILEAQMTIEVSLGLVGCKPNSDAKRYSRLYCLISDHDAIMALIYLITEINQSVMQTESIAELLTGFALDTGDTVMFYVEGPKDGRILRVWERTEVFYPAVKPIFSKAVMYRSRLYPEMLLATKPFNIMKMFVPLSVLLGLTPIYARPALPLPTRSAVLKIGRLIISKLKSAPNSRAMPTAMELRSFRLELCVLPAPPPV